MKINRQKKVKKILCFYINNFKFREPYQVLVEGTFTYAALKNKVQITEQIPKYFQGEVKFLTTKCLILELEKLAEQNKKLQGTMKILKNFALHKCGHEKSVIGAKCIEDMLQGKNPSRYIVATQDRALQEQIRQTPGTPLLYLHSQTPHLEPASKVDQLYAEDLRNKVTLTAIQEESLKKLKENAGIVDAKEEKVKKKKKKKGGPNPLSCLKKKKKPQQQEGSINKKKVQDGKVKKAPKKKVRIPAHVRDELTKQILKEREKKS